MESFNGKFRDECLGEHGFADIPHAGRIIEALRVDYNEVHPHSALGNVPPRDFAEQAPVPQLRPRHTGPVVEQTSEECLLLLLKEGDAVPVVIGG